MKQGLINTMHTMNNQSIKRSFYINLQMFKLLLHPLREHHPVRLIISGTLLMNAFIHCTFNFDPTKTWEMSQRVN